jgi:hypothetical protein
MATLYPINVMTFDTSIFVKGYIVSANLVSPRSTYGNENKYIVHVTPDDPTILLEIERRMEEYKLLNEDPFVTPDYEVTKHKDLVTEGCTVVFSSILKPHLRKSLSVARDEELLYKHVDILGRMQILKDGNCFISLNEIYESAPPSADIDSDFTGVDDDGF